MNIIDRLEVRNFRSHDKFLLECKNPTTLIIGENGSGKTSLLEAIYIVLRGKSFKSADIDIIKRGKKLYKVSAKLSDGKIRSISSDITKTFKIDGRTFHRLPKKYKFPIILFQPSNMNLVSSSPASRRAYLDEFISQLDENYAVALTRYEKALKQRNQLLKALSLSKDAIFPWNIILARYGCQITAARIKYIDFINQKINKVYKSIAAYPDKIYLSYHQSGISESNQTEPSESYLLSALEQSLSKDKIIGHTTLGPHRDDIDFIFNGRLASTTASRGETRSIIIALKFTEAAIIEEILGITPLILLDDIFSELDESRSQSIIKNFKKHQIILTSTAAPSNLQESAHL